ncbi:MAG: hypothetical protein NTX51_14155 [Verrucomicrobia bacterium]|nr:hypothetical protein [Verrucomicrobiota bacterium]
MKNCSTFKSPRATNARRNSLKSLLTLASGAASLGALAPSAEAGKADIVYTPFGTGMTVGFGGGQEASVTRSLPGGATITLNREANTASTSNRILARIGGGYFARQSNNRSAAGNPPGTNVALRTVYGFSWNNAAPGERVEAAAFGNIIRSTTDTGFLEGPGAFNSIKYLLFQFQNAGATEYGWIGMSGATITPGNSAGMSVTFTGYAYDTSGAKINAGDTGTAAVPEPSNAVVGLLMAAMVAGGVGVRQWRKSKPANVSQPA